MAKKTIRTIPQERTPMPEQPARYAPRTLKKLACGYHPDDALRESERCLMCPDQPCIAGVPVVGINIPGFIQKINEKDFPFGVRNHRRNQPVARHLWPCLPAGKPVRRAMHGRRIA